jgi:hypothetical protein
VVGGPGATSTPTLTPTPTFTPTPTPAATATPGGYQVKVNCGGSAADGLSADQAYTTGSWGYLNGSTYEPGDPVTSDYGYPTGLKSQRFASNLSYKFDLPNSYYTVKLYFAERFYTTPGSRVFNVKLEGISKLSNLDVYATVGHDVGLEKVFTGVMVNDGVLNIDFTAITDNAIVNAIVVQCEGGTPPTATPTPSPTPTPTPPPPLQIIAKVNCGGGAVDGLAADQKYTFGSWGYTDTTGAVRSTTSSITNNFGYPEGMKSQRYGKYVGYNFTVPNGLYTVKMYFAEYSSNTIDMNVDIEGSRKLTDFIVCNQAGGALKGIAMVFSGIAVSDGVLNIGLSDPNDSYADINVIQVEQYAAFATPLPTPTPEPPEDGGLLLSDGWKILGSTDTTLGPAMSQTGYNTGGFIPATVPGNVLASYVRYGALPEPNYAKNLDLIRSLYNDIHYYYRTEFNVPGAYVGKRVWLNFEGVARDADIYVNGTKVGSIYGVYVRGKFDVTSNVIIGGNNCLAVLIYKQGGGGSGDPNVNRGQLFAGHNMGGNECHPSIPGSDIGIYQEVFLSSTGAVKINDPFVVSDLPLPSTATADLVITAEVQNATSASQSGKLKGAIGSINFEQNVSLNAGEKKLITFDKISYPQLTIANPQLWWPNGYGGQPLYTLSLTFQMTDNSVSDTKSTQFGIRKVTYDTSVPDNLKILVNGKPILCRGGSWMSPDLLMRYDAAQAEIDGKYHQDMGFTMVRFWKGQVPFRQAYDAFDKYGILCWNEWWGLGGESWTGINNWGYGGISNNDSKENIRDMLKRIRNHPCVALYVGNNEVASPGEGVTLFNTQKNELHPQILFVDHSCLQPLHPGDGPWSATDPKDYWNRASSFGFYSEIGLPHVLSVESMRKMIPESLLWPVTDGGVNPMWSYHQIDAFNTGGADYLSKIDTQYGLSSTVEEFCQKASVLDYDHNRAIMEGGRNSMWNGATGYLLWMSKSAWANLNWSTYDYYNGVDGTYFGNKKANEPVHIQWDCRNEAVMVVNNTLQDMNGLTAEAWIYNSDGTQKYYNSVSVNAVANARTSCFTISDPSGLSAVHFVRLRLKDGSNNVWSDNFYWEGNTYLGYTGLNSLPVVDPGAAASKSVSGDETTVTVTLANNSANIAFFLRLNLLRDQSNERVLPAIYQDNYISLAPNESRVVKIKFKTRDLGGEQPKLMLEGYNMAAKQITVN